MRGRNSNVCREQDFFDLVPRAFINGVPTQQREQAPTQGALRPGKTRAQALHTPGGRFGNLELQKSSLGVVENGVVHQRGAVGHRCSDGLGTRDGRCGAFFAISRGCGNRGW